MSDIIYPENCIKVLDKGFVRLVDFMGDDSAIVQAARVSYGKGTKQVSEDTGLIRYLLRHMHTTPFEQVVLKFHVRLPIFVARQWIRHRTFAYNEYSGRYSEMPDMFYQPTADKITKQSTTNKQGGSEEVLEHSDFHAIRFGTEQTNAYDAYKKAVDTGMRKELARINLPLSQYTEWYVTGSLHNWFHFLKLRLDSHAQWEIRVYGEAIAEYIKQQFPIAYKAFEDYRLNSMQLSEKDIKALFLAPEEVEAFFGNKREYAEFIEKLKRIRSNNESGSNRL